MDALTLLEAQRHAMAMYTSCGWFFNDLAGLETVQVLRYAARVMDLLAELGEDPGEEAFLDRAGQGRAATCPTRATAGASGAPTSSRPGSTPAGWPPTWP